MKYHYQTWRKMRMEYVQESSCMRTMTFSIYSRTSANKGLHTCMFCLGTPSTRLPHNVQSATGILARLQTTTTDVSLDCPKSVRALLVTSPPPSAPAGIDPRPCSAEGEFYVVSIRSTPLPEVP
ncbi:hypothetical protein CBL_01245 [Carabus blaptoides fortunei]